MASADFPGPLGPGISLGQCRPCPFTPSGSTVTVDDSGASRVVACSPAALGLTASSCSYGRRFASGPFAPVPYGSNLTFGYGGRHLPVGDLSPREVRHLPGTRPRLARVAARNPPPRATRPGASRKRPRRPKVRTALMNSGRTMKETGNPAGDRDGARWAVAGAPVPETIGCISGKCEGTRESALRARIERDEGKRESCRTKALAVGSAGFVERLQPPMLNWGRL